MCRRYSLDCRRGRRGTVPGTAAADDLQGPQHAVRRSGSKDRRPAAAAEGRAADATETDGFHPSGEPSTTVQSPKVSS